MRLRAEYLYSQSRFDEISFRFLGDGKMHSYREHSKGTYNRKTFDKYLLHVFNFANTASLKLQLNKKSFDKLAPGDVLIQSGNPYGHAVMVMDVCVDADGNRRFMLSQSYMPAQDIQILIEPGNPGNAWYHWPDGNSIETPEWTFDTTDLRSW
jgi:hypothetical protein